MGEGGKKGHGNLHIEKEIYMAITGSTSHGSGTSRFMVSVLDNGILAKNALGPLTVSSILLKSSCKNIGTSKGKGDKKKIQAMRFIKRILMYHCWHHISVVILQRNINKGILPENVKCSSPRTIFYQLVKYIPLKPKKHTLQTGKVTV